MSLNVEIRESNGVTIFELEGKILVGESSQKLHDAIRERLKAGARKLVLQLSGVTYIDSSGVGQIVGALTATRQVGGEVRLADLTPKVRDLMTITNLNRLFDLNQTEAAAVSSFL